MSPQIILEKQHLKLVDTLPKIWTEKQSAYRFKEAVFEKLPSAFMSQQIIIEKRQRYLMNSLENNLIIKLNKSSARALALTLLSHLFKVRPGFILIDLENKASEVREIHLMNYAHEDPPIHLTIDHYDYQPQLPQEFSYLLWKARNPDLSHDIDFNLVNDHGELADEFKNKNTLFIQGRLGGIFLLSECLLNLSLENSETNYLNFEFNPTDKCDLPVSNLSCSGRIEIHGR